uniref:TEP1-F n=1 Tax=Musca domestica TaxID=7370 RepID=A0A1I8MYQ6_MUSDO
MRYFLLNIALLLGSVIFVASQGYYSVLAPGHIQSNRNYTVLVTIHQSPEPVKVNVTIEGPTFEIHEEVFLNPFESKAITILPPKLTDGEHKLIVQGVSGLRFYNESELIEIVDAGPTVNIQTDKAVYKPGDLVQFRVVLMDEHTSYYSVLAPGHIQSNRNYTVLVTIHQSPEPVKVNVTIEGPTFEIHEEVFLNPFESKAITILPPKLTDGEHKLIVQGVSGLRFYNESELIEIVDAGPTINIQTDKAVYKPGDLVQFRVVLMDEHTRPLKISEPIRVEITDGINNRVKQFKDISFVKGVYKNQFQLSEYPVMGVWHIRVHISGRYDLVTSKSIKVQRYLLPKFSVYVETDRNIVLGDQMTVQALIYGQYTFEKYVEGQVKLRLVQDPEKIVLEERVMQIKDLLNLGIHLNNTESLREAYGINMEVELREKFTQQISSEKIYIHIHEYPYQISVLPETIKFAKGKPYQLTAKVREWNDLPLMDDIPLIMEHASRNYSVPLDANGEATFQFEHEPSSDHTFWYGNVTYLWGNIFAYEPYTGNVTDLPLTLELLTEKPQFGSPVRIQVTSLKGMPYLVYTIVGHANFIYTEHIKLPTNPRTHILEITPSIAMIPIAVVYVHYIDGGNLRYSEIRIKFPLEFENKVSIMAPKQVKPGAEVNLEVRAQPKSLVGILAVDLGVYLLDPSYDFKKEKMLEALQQDTSRLPFLALVYPGLMSGVLTLTNAHYEFVPLQVDSRKLPDPLGELTFRKNFPETWIFENYE